MIKTLIIIEILFIILLAVCLGFQITISYKEKRLTLKKVTFIFVLTGVTLTIIWIAAFSGGDVLPKAAFILTTAILLYESVTDIISYDIYTIPVYAGIALLLIFGLVNADAPSGVMKVISFPMILCIVLEAVNYINNGYIGEGDILITELLAFNAFSVRSKLCALSLTVTIALLTIYKLGERVFHRNGNTDKEPNIENKVNTEDCDEDENRYPLAPFIYVFYIATNIFGIFQIAN